MAASPENPAFSSERRSFLQRILLGSTLASSSSMLSQVTTTVASPQAVPTIRQYKRLGSTTMQMSDISFGGSSLRDNVDLVQHALAKGINYFDTAESYTGGDSEETLGKALRGKRPKVYLASKGSFDASDRQDAMMRTLEGSLRRLQTDYIDVYFNHAVNDIKRLQNPEFYAFVERAKQQGKIRYVGLSGHAGRLVECLEYAIGTGKFDVMLVAYNFGQDPSFMQRVTRSFDFVATHPQLPQMLEKAKAAGMGVIAMKTLRGARLNDMRPYEQGGATFAQAAFRWVLANQHVDALVVTMHAAAEVDEFVAASGGRKVTGEELGLLQRYAALHDATYCRPLCNACEAACPEQVSIADVLRHKMYFEHYGEERLAMEGYARLPHNASACVTCAHQSCTKACPYGLSIPELTRRAHRELAWTITAS
jgi:uncharacterized protein